MLNEYLYFYYRRVKSLSMIQKADHPRGEMIYLINRELEEQLARLELPRDFEQAFSLYMTAYGKRENAYFSVESGACRAMRSMASTSVPAVSSRTSERRRLSRSWA